MIAVNFAAMVSSASSQLMRSNCPLPFGPLRARLSALIGGRDLSARIELHRASWLVDLLDEDDKTGLDATKALRLMTAHPTLIKRPVIEFAGAVMVGFDGGVKAALAVA